MWRRGKKQFEKDGNKDWGGEEGDDNGDQEDGTGLWYSELHPAARERHFDILYNERGLKNMKDMLLMILWLLG